MLSPAVIPHCRANLCCPSGAFCLIMMKYKSLREKYYRVVVHLQHRVNFQMSTITDTNNGKPIVKQI